MPNELVGVAIVPAKLRSRSNLAPLAAAALVILIAATAVVLRLMGRIWWCECGQPNLWSSDANGRHNSQHLFDPYSFTHLLHGLLFFGGLAWLIPKAPLAWRFVGCVAIECAWELFENTPFVTGRFRAGTAAVGYVGDSIANSMGDVLSCVIGFWIAYRWGLWASVAIFVVVELVLIATIRDSLFLSTLMLIHPFEAIQAWQGNK